MTPVPVEKETFDRWQIELYECVESTNVLARHLPPWTAIRALKQSGGRGRFERSWYSPTGGLWTTLVLPHKQPNLRVNTEVFPLAVGQTLVWLLQRLGLNSARLRWPNDLMVEDKKLGGILMELQINSKVLLGLGLNVQNQLPESSSLQTPATRLMDHLDMCPEPAQLLLLVLEAVTELYTRFFTEGFTPFMEAINASIAELRQVEISLINGAKVGGLFAGVDEHGNPILRGETGGFSVVRANEVARFSEISNQNSG